MENSKKQSPSQEQNNIVLDKSILDQILDDFANSLSRDASFCPEIVQALREVIDKGEYKDKETIIKLFKKENT